MSEFELKRVRVLEWMEPPMCLRAKKIILGLLNKINTLENVEHFLVTEHSVDRGPSQTKNEESSDVIRVIASEVHRLKLLLTIVLFLICVILFK